MYKLVKDEISGVINSVRVIDGDIVKAIPFAPDNTDYTNFKKEILADEAQLQDAEGNIMADAKAYVASLP